MGDADMPLAMLACASSSSLGTLLLKSSGSSSSMYGEDTCGEDVNDASEPSSTDSASESPSLFLPLPALDGIETCYTPGEAGPRDHREHQLLLQATPSDTRPNPRMVYLARTAADASRQGTHRARAALVLCAGVLLAASLGAAGSRLELL
jgi:hypothetical protein